MSSGSINSKWGKYLCLLIRSLYQVWRFSTSIIFFTLSLSNHLKYLSSFQSILIILIMSLLRTHATESKTKLLFPCLPFWTSAWITQIFLFCPVILNPSTPSFISALTWFNLNSLQSTLVNLCSLNSSLMNPKWVWISLQLIPNTLSVVLSIIFINLFALNFSLNATISSNFLSFRISDIK